MKQNLPSCIYSISSPLGRIGGALFIFFFQFVICNLQPAILHSQPTQQWVATFVNPYGNNVSCLDMTIDTQGNVYITGGIIRSDYQNVNYITIKYNTSGVQQWAVEYNGPGSNSSDAGDKIAVDKMGNVYVTGVSEQTGWLSNAFCTIKYNSSGAQQWVARYRYNPNGSNDHPTAIVVDDSGNVFVAGVSSGIVTGNDYVTIKYDFNGDSVWVKRFNGSGNGDDNLTSLYLDIFGNVYITGSINLYPNGEAGTIKYDKNGVQQWLNYPIVNERSGGNNVLLNASSNYLYVAGAISNGYYNSNFLLIKYSTNGTQQWIDTYHRLTSYNDSYQGASDMVLDLNQNIFLTGYFLDSLYNENYIIIKYNSNGDTLWTKVYYRGTGESTYPHLAIDKYNDVYLTGNRWNGSNYEFSNLKYNSSGVQQWLMTYPGGGKVIKVDKYLDVYVTGSSNTNPINIITIKYSQVDEVKQISGEIPSKFILSQNYPNPFNPTTKIKFNIPASPVPSQGGGQEVSIKIYDILGREIASFLPPLRGGQEGLQPGSYEVTFDGNNFASGVYFYQLIADGNIIDTKKMLLLK